VTARRAKKKEHGKGRGRGRGGLRGDYAAHGASICCRRGGSVRVCNVKGANLCDATRIRTSSSGPLLILKGKGGNWVRGKRGLEIGLRYKLIVLHSKSAEHSTGRGQGNNVLSGRSMLESHQRKGT